MNFCLVTNWTLHLCFPIRIDSRRGTTDKFTLLLYLEGTATVWRQSVGNPLDHVLGYKCINYYYYLYLLYIGYSPVCPQTNPVPSGYTVAATLSFYCQYAVRCVSPSFLRWFWWSSTSALSGECVQCLMWLFSVVPELHGFLVCCPRIS